MHVVAVVSAELMIGLLDCQLIALLLQNIEGNVANDIILSVIAYPLVAVQMYDEAVVAEVEGERKQASGSV
jgi:hypothetical protein